MKYTLAKDLTAIASQILHQMRKNVFGDGSKFARIFSRKSRTSCAKEPSPLPQF
jgi:hypothetical protein